MPLLVLYSVNTQDSLDLILFLNLWTVYQHLTIVLSVICEASGCNVTRIRLLLSHYILLKKRYKLIYVGSTEI